MHIFLAILCLASAAAQTPKVLARRPALAGTRIVFSYAGDLWTVPRTGGDAVRLTSGEGQESNPVVSPDGTLVAFSGQYDGNTDVFTVPVTGGVPKRLTWHPQADIPLAFTPDGKRILIRSARLSPNNTGRLFTIPLDGGFAEEVPLPMAEAAALSPDGQRLAYTPVAGWDVWKRYRGGRMPSIWIANLADSKVEKIPAANSNDTNPMWTAGRIWFLSDRNGRVSLWSYDPSSKRVAEALPNTGLEFKSASAAGETIVIEQFGQVLLYDIRSGKAQPVTIRVNADLPGMRPYYDKVGARFRSPAISPAGARVALEARGEILTVPAEKGDTRNLTNSSGVADRSPAWSPDGRLVAWLSDESGEYALHVGPQSGLGEVRKYELPPAFYFDPRWSPDSKKILLRDSNLALHYYDLDARKLVKIDQDSYDSPFRAEINASWSPDSRWVAYTKLLKNHLRAVHVYSLVEGQMHQITDGLSDARHAAFDRGGRYLYFTASTNVGLGSGWLDMSSLDRQSTRNAYLIVLRKDDPSPLLPESDEERPEEPKKPEPPKPDAAKAAETRIDLDSIGQRILSLPIPARAVAGLDTAKNGAVFLHEAQSAFGQAPAGGTLHKFDLKTRKFEKFLDDVSAFQISANGEKMLFRQAQRWAICGTAAAPRPGEGTLKTDALEVRVDPPAEWRQMYREAWRIERDFFYDPNLHGVPVPRMKDLYAGFLDAIAHRADFTYLLVDMLGELSAGHTFVSGGAFPEVKTVPVGLLGADYRIENNRYRFARVYSGENWNPGLRAPLTAPGVNVQAGEYLLAVNGRDVAAADEVYRYFEGASDRQTVLRVGPNPDGSGSREVTVIPVPDESGLRNLAWIEDNRRLVDRLSGGRLGYVYLPNTSTQGYANFNRWFFAQTGKQGIVLDERFNGGGFVADYIIDYLRRPLWNFFTTRAGETFTTPMNGIFGPKAMVINEYAFSGGDAMPWYFRAAKIGPLVGKRTGGGLIGNTGFVPPLLDGGSVTAPNLAFYNLKGQWDVENNGVAPDVEVELDPALWRQGRDAQLEKAVEILLEELKKSPPPTYPRPAYPNFHQGK
jgi:tricorn protease